MSTTINSTKIATEAVATTTTTTITKSPENCVSTTATLVVVAAPAPAASAVDNIIISSSPCNSCSSSLTSWSDVLCANAYCSSLKQQKQRQQQQQIYKNNKEQKEEENAPLNKTTITMTTSTSTTNTIIIPHLADCQSNLTKQQQLLMVEQQDSTAFDSGRESVNDYDSSLDDSIKYPSSSSLSLQQPNKKPCTLDFYTSSGSQTKWYLPSSTDIVKINVQPAVAPAVLMTKSCVSIAEPESSVVTPPSENGDNGELDDEMTRNDKM
ncbi:uncharacterized protein ACRADG_003135 isoform 1-T1 [Cochliomyia hominivorax]